MLRAAALLSVLLMRLQLVSACTDTHMLVRVMFDCCV